jgi:hypothetical protein
MIKKLSALCCAASLLAISLSVSHVAHAGPDNELDCPFPTNFATKNSCFTEEALAGNTHTGQLIILQSNGAGIPSAEAVQELMNQPTPAGGGERCFHAAVDNKGVIFILPPASKGWGAGERLNNISFYINMCEDPSAQYDEDFELKPFDKNDPATLEFYKATHRNAVICAAWACKTFGIDPEAQPEVLIAQTNGQVPDSELRGILTHGEAAALGLGTSKKSPLHLWRIYDVTTPMFRHAVKCEFDGVPWKDFISAS